MEKINIKMLTESSLAHLNKNLQKVTELIQNNENNDWIYKEFPDSVFTTKTIMIDDFELEENPESKDKEIDLRNSIKLYEHLKDIPRYILTDEKFWLWLYLDKYYNVSKSIMKIKNSTTIKDHWTFTLGKRRGLMFGILSRCYFRVEFSVCKDFDDKYELTKWVIENPERYRNFTWRSYSSETSIVRAALKGEYRGVKDSSIEENNNIYPSIAKYISELGSVRLLDVISEDDLEDMVYNKTLELLKKTAEINSSVE